MDLVTQFYQPQTETEADAIMNRLTQPLNHKLTAVSLILTKLEFSRLIFENTRIKFHENPPSGSRDVA